MRNIVLTSVIRGDRRRTKRTRKKDGKETTTKKKKRKTCSKEDHQNRGDNGFITYTALTSLAKHFASVI